MKVFYSRISTNDGSQNDERQLQNLEGFDYVLSDKCSGSIPIWERPQGKQIKKLIDEGKLNHIEIHSIDRLGRNTLNVLAVWQELSELGVRVVCRNPNFQNLTEDGKTDMFSELLISILSTMSSFEKSMIKARQSEGIKVRKAKGLYSGREIGSSETKERFLSKPKNIKIIEYLNKGTHTYDDICKILRCSPATIKKVKDLILVEHS
jgi:DNA invertase Pin-like site-specific DNA recombinase